MEEDSRDFLTCYREFFEEMFNSSDLDYPLPVQVAKYNIRENELKGEIISWCYEFLMARKCEPHLSAILCNETLKETLQAMRVNRETYGFRPNARSYSSLQLMQMTIKNLVAVCSNYRDNAKLSTLPPPPCSAQGRYPVASTYGVKNTRRKMEDRHVAIRDVNALYNLKDSGPASFYAVFDGHNGAEAAAYCCCHVHQFLIESPFYNNCTQLAFADAFQLTDARFIDKSTDETLDSGTTVLCALIKHEPKCLYVAWLGDSQAVLVSKGKYSQLVLPHRPDNKDERDRINDLGGTVMLVDTWRVNGQLAVSRAIGDAKHKPFVSADPDVRIVPLTGEEEFLVMASDGLWDFVSEQEVVESVYRFINENPGQTDRVANHLVGLAKTQYSRDNISVVVVFLTEPDPRTIAGIAGGVMSVTREVDVAGELWRRQSALPGLDCLSPVNNDFNGTDSDKLCLAKALVNQAHTMEKWVQPACLGKEQREMLSKLPWNCRPNPISYAEAVKLTPPKSVVDVNGVSDEQESHLDESAKPGEISTEETFSIVDEVEKINKEKEEEANNDVVDAEADSGEESEEEWNYIPGQENKPRSDTDQPIPSDDDMSQLNPNAAEFVPVLPSLEPVLSSSPAKGSEKSLENIKIPSQRKFIEEISSRPADLDSSFENCSGNESTFNGDDLTGVSTKAVFGDSSPSNMSVEEKREENPIDEYEKFDSTNPFADDVTQRELVENHFEAPTLPLDKIEEEVKVDNLLDTDFAHHSEKPDLLSPIDNPHHAASSNNEQQTSSSGFDSESGNEEPDFIASDKCDLIADVPSSNEKPREVVEDGSNPFYIEEKNVVGDDEGAPLSDVEDACTSERIKTVEFATEQSESIAISPVPNQFAVNLMQDVDSSDNLDLQKFEHPPKFQFSDDAPLEEQSTEKGYEFTDNFFNTENERLSVFNFSNVKPDETPSVQAEIDQLEAPVDHLLSVEQAEQGVESDSFELINHNEEDCDSMKGIQNLQEEERVETAPVELEVRPQVDDDLPPLQESSVDDVVEDLIGRAESEPAVESVEKQIEEAVAPVEEQTEETVETEKVLVEASAPPRSPSPIEATEEIVVPVETPLVEDKVLPIADDQAPSIVNEPAACVVEDVSSAPLVDTIESVDTPPPTPAAEASEDSGLTAVAIGTTGIAAVAGAAAVLISETKKDETKPISKGSPIKKPTTTTSAKKPEPVSKTTTMNKTTAAQKSGAMKPSSVASSAAPKKAPATTATTAAAKTLTSRTTTTKPATSKPTTPTSVSKPSTPTSRTALGGVSAKPTTTTTTAASKTTTAPKLATTSKPAAQLKTSAAAAAAKPRVGPASAAAPAKTAMSKPAVSSTTKKIEPTKTTTTAAARTTTSSRPTSATSTTTSRPSSATTRVAPSTVKAPSTAATRTSTTTAAARPTPARASSAAVKQPSAAVKTTTTTALKSSTATSAVKAPPTKTPATKSSAAPPSSAKPKPASPTVVKKPGAADKTANNKLSSTGKLVANGKKPSVDVAKTGKVSPDKVVTTETTVIVNNEQEEPVTQEPVVTTTTTTNGHLDNGVDSIDTSAYTAGIIESH